MFQGKMVCLQDVYLQIVYLVIIKKWAFRMFDISGIKECPWSEKCCF